MRRRSFWVFLFLAFWILLPGVVPAGEMALTLADAGTSGYTIVLPENPTPVQTTAANELADVLKEISGARLPIVSESAVTADPSQKLLVIGPSAASSALLVGAVDEDTLGYDAIVIRQVGNSIVFSGHPTRGMLYAVNTFLEDELGCRWWTATESFIPKLEKVTADDFDVVYTPKLINRESFYAGVIGADNFKHAVHLKCNGNSNAIPEEYGGHQAYLYFVHSFYPIVPPTEFETHPDWFPEIDGIRKVGLLVWEGDVPDSFKAMCERLKPEQIHSGGTQLCLTNEELFQEMLKRVLAAIKANPQATIISISQNDWHGYCECAKCKVIAEEEESQIGPYIRFVNRMAEEIEKVYPGIYIDTLAYQFTRKPPKLTRARDNVIIRLCSIECSFIQTLADGLQNASFRDDMEGWARMADHIFVWDYVTNFSLYLLPFPNYRVWTDNINYFTDHNVVGLFEQGDYHSPTGDFVQMRAWVMAKLLWNPSLDQRELMKEYIAGYYAPELVPVYMDYFNLLADSCEASGIHLGIFRSNANDWIGLDTLLKATALQDRAQKIARELEVADPKKYAGLLFKVRRERIPLDLVWLQGYPVYRQKAMMEGIADFPSVADMEALALDFNARLDANGVTKQSEWASPEQFARFKDDFVKRYSASMKEAPVPEVCRNLQRGHWVDLQTIDFNLASPGEQTFPEEDPNASDGEAVRIPSSHHEWSVQYGLNILDEVFPGGTATPHVYAFVRAEPAEGDKLPEGALLTAGVYNFEEKRGQIDSKAFTAAELGGGEYRIIDLGEVPLAKHLGLWLAPVENTETPFNIYVDRIVITL